MFSMVFGTFHIRFRTFLKHLTDLGVFKYFQVVFTVSNQIKSVEPTGKMHFNNWTVVNRIEFRRPFEHRNRTDFEVFGFISFLIEFQVKTRIGKNLITHLQSRWRIFLSFLNKTSVSLLQLITPDWWNDHWNRNGASLCHKKLSVA